MKTVTPGTRRIGSPPAANTARNITGLLGSYLDVIYKRRYWIVSGVALAVSMAWGFAELWPQSHKGASTLNFSQGTAGHSGGSNRAKRTESDRNEFVESHLRTLRSGRVLTQLAKSCQTGEPIQLSNLRIERPQDRLRIRIAYRAVDPHTAAAVPDCIARSYMARMQTSPSAGEANEQLKSLEAKMQASNQALLDLEKNIGANHGTDKSADFNAKLSHLRANFERAQSDRASKEATLNMLRGDAQNVSQRSPNALCVKDAMDNKRKAEQVFAEAKTIYGDRHPEYRRAESEVHRAEVELKSAQDLTACAEKELETARAREAKLKRAYLKAQANAKPKLVVSGETDHDVLRERANADLTAYEQMLKASRPMPTRVSEGVQPDPNPALACGIALLSSVLLGCVAAILHGAPAVRAKTS